MSINFSWFTGLLFLLTITLSILPTLRGLEISNKGYILLGSIVFLLSSYKDYQDGKARKEEVIAINTVTDTTGIRTENNTVARINEILKQRNIYINPKTFKIEDLNKSITNVLQTKDQEETKSLIKKLNPENNNAIPVIEAAELLIKKFQNTPKDKFFLATNNCLIFMKQY